MEDLSGKDDFVNQEETMGRTRVAGFTLLEQKTPKGQRRKKTGNEAMFRSGGIRSPGELPHPSLFVLCTQSQKSTRHIKKAQFSLCN